MSIGVSAKSAHADAARKFLEFVLSKDGQAAMVKGESTDFFFVPVVKGVAAKPGRKTDINFIILDDKAAAVATLAAAAALSTTLLGALFAFALRRTNLPFRRFIALTPWLIFLTPGYLKGLAWVLLISPGGYLAQFNLLPDDVSQAFLTWAD